MKKLFLLAVMSLFAAAAVAQQSLGDAARANRAKKHASATTKLDDDNFARSAAPSSGPAPKEDAASKDASKTDEKGGEAKDSKKDAAEAQKQKNDQIKGQIESQKKEIATLQREIDIAEREARLRAAAYYADAGVMLRDQAKFAEDSRKSQSEIDSKKQALSAAQEKLSDLQEQARKAGLPSSD
jgi:chromosome segregation ATPase